MNPALVDVERFLAQTPPFDALDPVLRRRAAESFDAAYHRRGATLLRIGGSNRQLFLIRRGAVEAHDTRDHLVGRYAEGESFGLQSLLSGKPVRFRITLIEDALIWTMDKAAFDRLRDSDRAFDDFYIRSLEERLTAALRENDAERQTSTLFMTPLGELARRQPISVTPSTSIADAARTMATHGVSSLLIGNDDVIEGILTDRDLRNRVLAQGRDASGPVREVMTPDPVTLDASSPVLAGIVAMAGRGIHHLPLTRDGGVVGMVTTRDLLSLQTHHPLYLAARIQKQTSVAGVIEVCQGVPRLFELALSSGLRAEEVPRVLTTITDTVTRRLIHLAEAELGPAPTPWAWLAFGSQARGEQSLKTDQDNGIVYADHAPAEADAYFQALAKFVCDGLAACGYDYCPGRIMATTPDWRQPLAGWIAHFANWTRLPDPEAVLRVSIFFDLRGIHGDGRLVARLHETIAEYGAGDDKAVFLSALARQAADYDIPLGFFRRFVLAGQGEHRETLEIKAAGLLPLTDLVRVRALQGGVTVAATRDRLARLVDKGVMQRADADRLDGAHRLLSGLRVRLHADLVRRGQAPHNHLNVPALSHAERAALRDAFVVVREAQRALKLDFPM